MQTSCISKNLKTMYSVDFTTNCPKRRAGKPCKYCYVEMARIINFNAKLVHEYTPYCGEVLKFKKSLIEKLNSIGGIRLFSFGDYMIEHDNDIQRFLDDCLSIGLKVKAITKQRDFIVKFHNHPAISVIHISVDNIGDGVCWKDAMYLHYTYSKVKIRAAIMKDSDIEDMKNVPIEIYTFNHAKGTTKKYGYKKYSKKSVKEWTEKLNGKVCCSTGTCATCNLKCGA